MLEAGPGTARGSASRRLKVCAYDRRAQHGVRVMTMKNDLVERLTENGSAVQDLFTLGIGRIENLGTVTRIVFYVPRVAYEENRPINEIVWSAIVPTDQLPVIAAALMRPAGKNLAAMIATETEAISLH